MGHVGSVHLPIYISLRFQITTQTFFGFPYGFLRDLKGYTNTTLIHTYVRTYYEMRRGIINYGLDFLLFLIIKKKCSPFSRALLVRTYIIYAPRAPYSIIIYFHLILLFLILFCLHVKCVVFHFCCFCFFFRIYYENKNKKKMRVQLKLPTKTTTPRNRLPHTSNHRSHLTLYIYVPHVFRKPRENTYTLKN